MGGGREEIAVGNDSQLNGTSTDYAQNSDASQTSTSPLFSRPFSSTHNPPRKQRATLTPDDFLAHAFGLDFAISLNRDSGSETGSSTPSDAPGSPRLEANSSSSSSSRGSSYGSDSKSQRKSRGGVLPKNPPRGTFSSVRRSSKSRNLASPPPSPSDPPSPDISISELRPFTHLLHVQDNPKLEPVMTLEKWRESAERRIERRRLRQISFAVDGWDCSMNPLPLDIDCRPLGCPMCLGLAPVTENNLRRHSRERCPMRNALDTFWPACETDEESNQSMSNSPSIDMKELVDRCDAMSVELSHNSSVSS